MKKRNLLVLAVAALALTSCGLNNGGNGEENVKPLPNYDKILTPTGAPALAFLNHYNDDKFVTTDPTNIAPYFAKAEYGMIVSEFYSSVQNIKKVNSHYKLARFVTGGNIFLVNRLGNKTAPTANDKIAVFGPAVQKMNMPVMALHALYPELNPDNFINIGVKDAIKATLQTGTSPKAPGVTFEYMVVPQPVLFAVKSANKDNPDLKIEVLANMRQEWNKKHEDQKYIPQAALFIHETMYEQNKEWFNNELELLDTRLGNLVTDPTKIIDELNSYDANPDNQSKRLGIKAPLIKALQSGNKNELGYINKGDTVDVNKFLTTVELPTFDDSIFLTR